MKPLLFIVTITSLLFASTIDLTLDRDRDTVWVRSKDQAAFPSKQRFTIDFDCKDHTGTIHLTTTLGTLSDTAITASDTISPVTLSITPAYSKTGSIVPVTISATDDNGVALGSSQLQLEYHTVVPRPDLSITSYKNKGLYSSSNKLKCSATNELWLFQDAILYHFNGTTWEEFHTFLDVDPRTIYNVIPMSDGSVWLHPINRQGLLRYDGTEWKQYDTTNSAFQSNWLETVWEDQFGRVIIQGSSSDGLYFFQNGSIVSFADSTSLLDGYIQDVTVSPLDSAIYISQVGGVSIYKAGWWKYATPENTALADTIVQSTFIQKDGTVWFDYFDGYKHSHGVDRYENNSVTNFGRSNKLLSDTVYRMLEYDEGKVVFPHGKGGLVLFDGSQWTYFDSTNSALFGDQNSLYTQGNGKIWGRYSSRDRGIFMIENEVITVFDTTNGLLSNAVYSLTFDSKDRIWVLYDGDLGYTPGISCFDGTKWIHISERCGLPTNSFSLITPALDGKVWLTSNSVNELVLLDLKKGGVSLFDTEMGSKNTVQKNLKVQVQQNVISLSGLTKQRTVSIDLLKLNGQRIFEKEFMATQNEASITMPSNLATGVYYLKVKRGALHSTHRLLL